MVAGEKNFLVSWMMFVYFNEEKWEEAANAKNVPTVLYLRSKMDVASGRRQDYVTMDQISDPLLRVRALRVPY